MALGKTFWTGLIFTNLLVWSAGAQYYTFSGNSPNSQSWQEPHEMFTRMAQNAYSLLAWFEHRGERPPPKERYNREKHFGSWIEETEDDDCYDIRHEVLIRDSQETVKFSRNNPCKVQSGKWLDPYSGQVFTKAQDIEIDHVVALKNSYDSGSWSWKAPVRCAFANFMGFNRHLLAASSAENQAKSDKGPDQWMPTNRQYACAHLYNWMLIKFIWNLNMSQEEAAGIAHHFKRNGCNPQNYLVSKVDIAKVRRLAEASVKTCRSYYSN